jgi:outer membrane receptor protein involved in Fe transport
MEILVIFKKTFVFLAMLAISTFCIAQETTGSLQGTIKDATGAVVTGAKVTVTAPDLVGEKSVTTDSKGYYHFSNLPPGAYVVTVEEKGFSTRKQEGLTIEVGHSPSLDMTLSVGSEAQVVDVTSESPQIDVTTVTTQTNITQDVINYVPRGTSFQSVIQFAPAASNEPLMGNTTTNGSGSVSPGNGSNGGSYGYSIAGGSDSENSYLVEGQETANIIGGYSHTNVPFDFIDQVQVKTSGIAAEYGGALGGVVDVIMKKGSPKYHGSIFAQFENQAMDAGPSPVSGYDQNGNTTKNDWVGTIPPCPTVILKTTPACGYQGITDAPFQSYQPKQDHRSDLLPGFAIGGPIFPFFSSLKDRLFFFVGFNPELLRVERKINYGGASAGGAGLGVLPFSQNTTTYYTTARVDAQAAKKVRVFASWLYQLQKQYGETMPNPDSAYGQLNYSTGCFSGATSTLGCTSSGTNPSNFSHSLGYDAPNITFNTGADITLTQSIVSTTRFGYYFENYHDFGFPTTGVAYVFETNGVDKNDTTGAPLPAGFQQATGYISSPLVQLTSYNSNKAIQLDQDIAWYKSTKFGTHNFKFGYSLNRDSNYLNQSNNVPEVQIYPGANNPYGPYTDAEAAANCGPIEAANGLSSTDCQGRYGYALVYDIGTGGSAISYNHGIFAQDTWTIGKGLTFDVGVRAEKENLPGEVEGTGVPPNPINFNWSDKIAPRVGFAWDPYGNGKMKFFGSYGVFYDQMKLNLAISSFGGAYWNNCAYAINNPDITAIDPVFNSTHRMCQGNDPSVGANFPGGTTPTGLNFIENLNYRESITTCATCNPYEEAVAPNLKPYKQHESVAGFDYQVSNTVAFELRYDRRRLDHVIEDSAIYANGNETFVIVNPGQGADSTFSGFCQFLYTTGDSGCISSTGSYPPNQTIPAARSYDGLEVRLNKALSNHWFGMFSYTYSRFRGNYTGLTSSDISDGGNGGRNAPNNSRAFDEPYFQYNANGGSSSGLLPTDRPNKLKGYAYYQLNYLHKFSTDFGLFQTVYEGSPNTTYMDVGASYNAYPVQLFDRGVWADIKQNPSTGETTVGIPYTYRNPWYIQSDFNLNEEYRVTGSKALSFSATFTNLLNEHAVTSVNEQVDTPYLADQYITPGGFSAADGVPFYGAAMNPYRYSVADHLNGLNINGGFQKPVGSDNGTLNSQGGPITVSSLYGTPHSYQLPRTIRLSVHFTF